MSIAQAFGATLLGRLIAEFDKRRLQVMVNPADGYCWALVQLGPLWPHDTRPVWCSRRAKDGMFCGQHDHFWAAIGAESPTDYIARHGGQLVTDENGEFVAYRPPLFFRKKPRVVPFKDTDIASGGGRTRERGDS